MGDNVLRRALPFVGSGSNFAYLFVMTAFATILNAGVLLALAFGSALGVLLAIRVMS